jgi:hypothetical protein
MTEFIRHLKLTPRAGRGRDFAEHPDEVLAIRAGLHKRMRELNAKGPPDRPLSAVL